MPPFPRPPSRTKGRYAPVATIAAVMAIGAIIAVLLVTSKGSRGSAVVRSDDGRTTRSYIAPETMRGPPEADVMAPPEATVAVAVDAQGAAEVTPAGEAAKVRMYSYEIVREIPHDARAFTQGIEFDVYDGREVFWESTGLYGKSQMREVEVDTGKVVRSISLPKQHFGEGLTKTSTGSLLQLTWKSGITFEYPQISEFHTGDFTAAAEQAGTQGNAEADSDAAVVQRDTGLKDGWGIAADGAGEVVVTDSSTTMYWFDEKTLAQKRSETITFEGSALPWVNELEWVNGEVWGNVWFTPCIARIDPATAAVRGWILLDGLKERTQAANKAQSLPMDVLNGIAYDSERNRVFVTGKKWARLYEIKVVEVPEADQESKLEDARTTCRPNAHPL